MFFWFLLWSTAWQSLVSNFKIILWLLDDARCHSDLLILLQVSWSQARDWLVVTRIDGDTSTLHWQSIFAASTYGPNMFGGWFSPLHSQTMSSLHWERLICVRFTCSTTCVFYSTGCRRSTKARWHAESDASLATFWLSQTSLVSKLVSRRSKPVSNDSNMFLFIFKSWPGRLSRPCRRRDRRDCRGPPERSRPFGQGVTGKLPLLAAKHAANFYYPAGPSHPTYLWDISQQLATYAGGKCACSLNVVEEILNR